MAYKMSESSEPRAALKAAEGQDGQEESREAATRSATSVYQAPYHSDPDYRNRNVYLVSFQPGYTLDEHFRFLGFEIGLTGKLDHGYYATLDDQVFNAVRYDPGVKAIEDDVLGEVEGDPIGEEDNDPTGEGAAIDSDHPTTSLHQAPYYGYPEDRNPGVYLISFQTGYTLAQHFAFLGFEIDGISRLNNGYYSALDDQVLNAVRYDPGVKFVDDDVIGEED